MWRAVFGPGLRLYGIDIVPTTKVYEADDASGRTSIFIGDQKNRSFWRKFRRAVPRLDIIIDDGLHSADAQMSTLREMWDHLSPGGVFITEDIHGENHGYFEASFKFFRAMHEEEGLHVGGKKGNAMQRVVDGIHYYPYLLVAEKRDTEATIYSELRGTQFKPIDKGVTDAVEDPTQAAKLVDSYVQLAAQNSKRPRH